MRLALLAIPAVRSALSLEIGRDIEYHPALASTQDRARELATAGAPEKGTFSITATYADPPSDIIGFAEVYTRSPRDGEIDEIVRVPLILAAVR